MYKVKSYVKKNWLFLLTILIIAVLGHAFFLKNQILNNQFMASIGDQLTQMMPFKDYLYNQFTQGDFFFSFDYGGGDNFFTRLSYYYSTSIIFYFSILLTYILETLNLVNPDIIYWTSSIVFISVIRLFLILVVTTKYIEYFNVNRKIALLSASFYAYAIIYYRHVALWEFFADGMLWLPLLLFGAEKVLQENKGTLFSIATALALFNNGYFAYINLLYTAIYILVRLFIRFNEQNHWISQIKTIIINGFVGLLISLPGFIPFVIGYLSNSRISGEVKVQVLNFESFSTENPLFNSTVFIVPTIFFFLFFYFDNFKNKKFFFFSLLSIIMLLLSNSTLIGSIFNGFSISQNRWQYIIALMSAVAIGIGVQNISQSKEKKSFKYAITSILLTFFLYFIVYQNMDIEKETIIIKYWFIFLVIQASILLVFKHVKNKVSFFFLLLFSFGLYFLITIDSQRNLYYDYELYKADKSYIQNNFYADKPVYDRMFDDINDKSIDYFTRLEYKTQKLNGSLTYETNDFYVYNSFINGNYQNFGKEFGVLTQGGGQTTSRMVGLGNRKILNSLLNVNYFIGKSSEYSIPYDYELINKYKGKELFENEDKLAFIHPVKNLYAVNEFNKHDFKDSYLVNGAIVDSEHSNISLDDSNVKDAQYNFDITIQNGEVNDNILSALSEGDIVLNISIPDEILENEQISMSYSLIPTNTSSDINYSINNESFNVLGPRAKYSSRVFNKQITLDTTNQITILLPSNAEYVFNIHNLSGINYDELRKRSLKDKQLEYEYVINNDTININFNNEANYPFMTLPLFNMLGWNLEINGNSAEIIEANYGMIGFFLPDGEVEITLTFRQPFLIHTIIFSVIGILSLILIHKRQKVFIN